MRTDDFQEIINGTESRSSRIFSLIIQFLILVSLVTFSIETLPNLSKKTQSVLYVIEVCTVAIFSIEYLLRILFAKNRLKFIFSFFGLIDLISILPFYVSANFDLRSLRVFRLLRLVRILKLVRYSAAIRRFHRALLLSREELILFGIVMLMLIYLSAVGIYYFENEAQPDKFASVFHSLWWSVVTLTTVGYGDIFPVTVGGRVFTFFVLLIGLGIVAVPTGLFSSALIEARKLEMTPLEDPLKEEIES
ncbi:ion transporter [Rubinisphaera italica]|uniref:Cyclic nucleotide-gated potassium channel n=1 Tax=Rubinisphaera italica TaxID=2527969 RepID=A0A5C5XA74_9PLAN|nr:ion transporter [Rubinisphaera italica]TWT59916.1 Cyclic nucleotide-gated potassium channel [Rubinisphaera italica]